MVLALPNFNPLLARSRGRLTPGALRQLLAHRRKRAEATIILVAVDPAHRANGVVGATLGLMLGAAKAAGYRRVGSTWISDDNPASIRQTTRFGLEPYHRTAWFVRTLA